MGREWEQHRFSSSEEDNENVCLCNFGMDYKANLFFSVLSPLPFTLYLWDRWRLQQEDDKRRKQKRKETNHNHTPRLPSGFKTV